MSRLAWRRALGTGAASGIARATAPALAREGAAVALLDIDEQRAQAERSWLARTLGFMSSSCDIGTAQQLNPQTDVEWAEPSYLNAFEEVNGSRFTSTRGMSW